MTKTQTIIDVATKLGLEVINVPLHSSDKPRCKDCDSDCWDVPNKLRCWMGNAQCDIAEGYCPWLMEGVEFPPKP